MLQSATTPTPPPPSSPLPVQWVAPRSCSDGWRLFQKYDKSGKTVVANLHVAVHQGREWSSLIAFRDQLVAHPAEAKKYEEFKGLFAPFDGLPTQEERDYIAKAVEAASAS